MIVEEIGGDDLLRGNNVVLAEGIVVDTALRIDTETWFAFLVSRAGVVF